MTQPSECEVNNRYELAYRLAREWGIFAAMSCALLYFAYQEHSHQREMLTETNHYIRDRLETVIKQDIECRLQLNTTIQQNTDTISELNNTFRESLRNPHRSSFNEHPQ